MSSNLMDTEPGGESDQYQSQHTVTVPHKKSGGQMGEPETAVDVDPSTEAARKAERGAQTAENIRYGQNISEHGMGGQTLGNDGVANQDGGYGDEAGDQTESVQKDDEGQKRRQQGLGGDRDMDREIGA